MSGAVANVFFFIVDFAVVAAWGPDVGFFYI